MTRRIYTYPAEVGWDKANALATVGAMVILIGGIVFILNAIHSLRHGDVAGDNPWDGGTLEWATSSPPPNYNFVHLPVATSRYPLWTEPNERAVVTGMRNDRREALVTGLMDADPKFRYVLPRSSIWPFVTAALSAGFLYAAIFDFKWYYPGIIATGIGLIGWFWPRPRPEEADVA